MYVLPKLVWRLTRPQSSLLRKERSASPFSRETTGDESGLKAYFSRQSVVTVLARPVFLGCIFVCCLVKDNPDGL